MSHQASSDAADLVSGAVARDGQQNGPATPAQSSKGPEVHSLFLNICRLCACRRSLLTPLQLHVDVASLQSPGMEVDDSSVLAPTTPAPNTLDAANKQQEEDLKLKYGVLPNRAALLRRDYQKVNSGGWSHSLSSLTVSPFSGASVCRFCGSSNGQSWQG